MCDVCYRPFASFPAKQRVGGFQVKQTSTGKQNRLEQSKMILAV